MPEQVLVLTDVFNSISKEVICVSTTQKSSGGYRALEIILGLVAFAAGILTLIYPEGVVVTIVILFGIALLIIGILRLGTAAFSALPGGARGTNAAIGIIAIIVALAILFFPVIATATVVILFGVVFLIYGIGRIVVGGTAVNLSGGIRAALVVVGILIAIFSIIVIFFPVIGVYTYAFFVSIVFLLIGIESLASGIAGTTII